LKGFPDLPPIWWLGSIGGIYFFRWLAPDLHFESQAIDFISRVLLLAALAIIGWSGIWFWWKKTPIEPHHAPKSLIKQGPYRLSRNPIYLSLVLLTVSSALWHGSIVGIALALALWVVLDRRFAAVEEDGLRAAFGEEADDYIANSRRWL
jgi:protein-S-isoprenylcysteine O-methyltransferase Ste14